MTHNVTTLPQYANVQIGYTLDWSLQRPPDSVWPFPKKS